MIAVSADTVDVSHDTWHKVAQEKFVVLSDPDGVAIRAYGLLDRQDGKVNTKRALVLVDSEGHERWQEPAGTYGVEDLLHRIANTK